MTVGEVNKQMMMVLVALLLGVMGWLWYSMMYKPAVQARESAISSKQQAQQSYDAAQQAVAAAQAEREKGTAKDQKSIAEVNAAKSAIPTTPEPDDAMVEIERIARKSGVIVTDLTPAEGESSSGAGDSVAGPIPLDMTISAHGTFMSIYVFIDRIQDLVEINRGTVYVHGRLVKITNFSIAGAGTGSGNVAAALGVSDSGGSTDDGLPEGHRAFDLTLRLYSTKPSKSTQATTGSGVPPSSTATSATNGTSTTNPSAAGTGANGTSGTTNPATSSTSTSGGSATTSPTSSTASGVPAGVG